ncbi:MAG: transglycosylase SLT domain-containing protein [Gammaproteobacteria bacterium]|nr:transglycosylase SLT domain-containing protein [Gammaproteobacteria bacterium]MDX2459855.1 transglycosylase SLT domain-containing protein [Gammaproteobacteria bacterium]
MNRGLSSSRFLLPILIMAVLAGAANVPAQAVEAPIGAAYAANQSIDGDIWYVIEQRGRFLQAESALRQSDIPRFHSLRDALKDYPLYPYLEFADISRRLGSAGDGEIEDFLTRYSDTPLAWRLRRTWLKRLAQRGNWQKYLDVYEQSSNATLRCQWLRALINADQADKAMPYVAELWLVGRSQPPACDPVFKAWRSGGNLTRELVWQRFETAIRNGRASLASYLIRYLDAEEQPLAQQWLRVRENPGRVMQVARMNGDRDTVEAILVYGVERMARRAPGKAATTWESLRTRFAFSGSAVATLHRRIGLSYAFAHRVEALYWLNAIPESQMDERAREWRILSSMQHGEWRQALAHILAIDDGRETAGPSSQRWRYWMARALESLDWPDDADAIYSDLARERSYYGFLAADRIEGEYQLKHRTLEYSSHELRLLEAQPAAMRARELYSLGRTVNARREWRMFTRGMDDEALARAAKLAQEWGWHGRAIMTVARTPHLDDLEMRFPLAYQDRVLEQARNQDLDPAWMYAIVRQESAFIADARSPAGALGLMQIMPGTGRRIGRSLDKPLKNRQQLLDADVSLEFGSTYLRTLLDQLDEHPVLAAAAYNAGIHRVERWRPAERNMSADLWIENIPYRETREYVRRVTAYTTIYEQRLGRETVRLSARLALIPSRATRLAQAEIASVNSVK